MDSQVYRLLRKELMDNPETAGKIPIFVKTCMDADDFWEFIKYEFETYAERRKYLRGEFQPLCEFLEQKPSPSVEHISKSLENLNAESVNAAWSKALQRSIDDPEGAITAARTLLEAVCMHILDGDMEPNAHYDLPKLYSLVSKKLSIAPSQHTENVFKQILGGCSGVVEGLGALRNRVGDAHGQGRRPVKVQTRHATLAVNLSGAMASFLVDTSSKNK